LAQSFLSYFLANYSCKAAIKLFQRASDNSLSTITEAKETYRVIKVTVNADVLSSFIKKLNLDP
jgi:hypothetical protein